MNFPDLIFYFLIPLIWLFGGTGSLLGLIVFFKKHMARVGPVHAYRLLFVSDLIFMLQMVNNYLNQNGLESPLNNSPLICRIFSYLLSSTVNWSPMLLVYISIEKFISIRLPAKKNILRKMKTQLWYFILVVLINAVINLPVFFYFKLIISIRFDNKTNLTTQSYFCLYENANAQRIVSLIYLVNKFLVPISLMIITSCLLIISVFKLRQRIFQNFLSHSNSNDTSKYKRNIRLAVASILVNLAYLVLNFPFAVYYMVPSNSQNVYTFRVVLTVFYFTYSYNFYSILLSNHLVQKELVGLFKK